jgi:putative FmdB family regulatory protein
MPIYEYACRGCGHRFERLVRRSSDPVEQRVTCPSCQSDDLEQLLSLFAVSSEGTKERNLQHGRKLAQKDQVEQRHAQLDEIKHHQH